MLALFGAELAACRGAGSGIEAGPECRRRPGGPCSASGGKGADPPPGGVPADSGDAGLGGQGAAGTGVAAAAGSAGRDSGVSVTPFARVSCRALDAEPGCQLEGEGAELVVRGDVIAPGKLYAGGELRVRADGLIACVGCDCGPEPARRLTCAGSVIAPAFVNPHDHVAYAHQPPRPTGPERYEHRHDWRLGLRGHAAIAYEGGASPAARAAHELRMLLGGTTAIAGGAGHVGLLRNLDMPGLEEGIPVAPADSDTFPLDDADGLLVAAGCAYGSGRTRPAEAQRWGAYLPHLGEGVDAAARNEVRCALEPDFRLIDASTALVHGIAVDARLAAELAARRAVVVWSPRSNVALYGNTAPVLLLLRSGVPVALGTDWLLSGSMNMLRELACARSFSERHLDGALTDGVLFEMATQVAARGAGVGLALGRLAPGFLADLLVVRSRGLAPHEAVVNAAPGDIELVLRGGTPLYGDEATVLALDARCEALDVCGSPKRVCLAGSNRTLAELRAATPYPLFSCDIPPDEPSCEPARPAEYDGVPTSMDGDGDGVLDEVDLCPRVFDPPRSFETLQADADGDEMGDACDPCPLATECSARALDDIDGDTIPNGVDRCPTEPDPAQLDADDDGVGDVCDPCAASNPGVTPCPLEIRALRDANHPAHPARHALVALGDVGVVAVRPDSGSSRGFYVQDARANFSGIFVYTGPNSPGVAIGDRLALRGRLDSYSGTAELVGVAVTAQEPGGLHFVPLEVAAADIGDGGSLANPLQSMLLRIAQANVVHSNPDAPSDYDELLLAGELRLDDLLHVELGNDFPVGTSFASVTGVLGQSFGHQKFWPRSPADIALAGNDASAAPNPAPD